MRRMAYSFSFLFIQNTLINSLIKNISNDPKHKGKKTIKITQHKERIFCFYYYYYFYYFVTPVLCFRYRVLKKG